MARASPRRNCPTPSLKLNINQGMDGESDFELTDGITSSEEGSVSAVWTAESDVSFADNSSEDGTLTDEPQEHQLVDSLLHMEAEGALDVQSNSEECEPCEVGKDAPGPFVHTKMLAETPSSRTMHFSMENAEGHGQRYMVQELSKHALCDAELFVLYLGRMEDGQRIAHKFGQVVPSSIAYAPITGPSLHGPVEWKAEVGDEGLATLMAFSTNGNPPLFKSNMLSFIVECDANSSAVDAFCHRYGLPVLHLSRVERREVPRTRNMMFPGTFFAERPTPRVYALPLEQFEAFDPASIGRAIRFCKRRSVKQVARSESWLRLSCVLLSLCAVFFSFYPRVSPLSSVLSAIPSPENSTHGLAITKNGVACTSPTQSLTRLSLFPRRMTNESGREVLNKSLHPALKSGNKSVAHLATRVVPRPESKSPTFWTDLLQSLEESQLVAVALCLRVKQQSMGLWDQLQETSLGKVAMVEKLDVILDKAAASVQARSSQLQTKWHGLNVSARVQEALAHVDTRGMQESVGRGMVRVRERYREGRLVLTAQQQAQRIWQVGMVRVKDKHPGWLLPTAQQQAKRVWQEVMMKIRDKYLEGLLPTG